MAISCRTNESQGSIRSNSFKQLFDCDQEWPPSKSIVTIIRHSLYPRWDRRAGVAWRFRLAPSATSSLFVVALVLVG